MAKKKSSRPQLLVVVSDLHCGSTVGLMPPDSENMAGNTLGFGSNHHQRWLWECWQDAQAQVAKLAGNDPLALLINGDATEGIHHRSPEVVASLIENHCQMAATALRPAVVQANQTHGRHATTVGQTFRHGRFGQSVLQDSPARKREWGLDRRGRHGTFSAG